MLMEGFKVLVLRASGLGLISSVRLDGWKDIQSLKLTWSICIQSLNPSSYLI